MTHPAPQPSPCQPRPNAEYRWTRAKLFAFLDALARHGDVSAAAREVGMSRQSAYRLRARFGPGAVADAWRAAQRNGRLERMAAAERGRAPGKATLWGPR